MSNFINLQNIDGKLAYLITILSECDGLIQSNGSFFFFFPPVTAENVFFFPDSTALCMKFSQNSLEADNPPPSASVYDLLFQML